MAQDGKFTGKLTAEQFYSRVAYRACEKALLSFEGGNYVLGRYHPDLRDAETARKHAIEKFIRQAEYDVRQGVKRNPPPHSARAAAEPDHAHEGLCSGDER